MRRALGPVLLSLLAVGLFGCRTASSPPDSSGALALHDDIAGEPAEGHAEDDHEEPISTMRVHFIDVGQGDATLLEFPCAAVLVDTGGEQNGKFSSRDAISVYLDAFFSERPDLHDRLELLVLTHPHIDHTRSAKWVLEHYAPRHVVTNGMTFGSGKWGQIAAHRYASESEGTTDPVGYEAVLVDELPSNGLSNAVVDPVACESIDPELRVLWGQVGSDPGWGSHFGKPRFANSNNHSVVLRVDYGEASVLLTGDLEDHAIEDFVTRYTGTEMLDVDVYQAGHHGSHNGTTVSLVDAMTPDYAVFSMGPKDREVAWTAWAYGHPRKDVVDLLEQKVGLSRPEPLTVPIGTGAKNFTNGRITKAIYATGWDGNIILEANSSGDWTVRYERSAPSAELIDLNTASASELEALPMIGPAKARAIIEDRDSNGPFPSVDAVTRVHGIGPATLDAIRSLVSV